MKKLPAILLFLSFISQHSTAQNPQLFWAASIGYSTCGNNSNSGNKILTSNTGMVYVLGTFCGTVDFDYSPAVYELNAAGTENFILKISPQQLFASVKKNW